MTGPVTGSNQSPKKSSAASPTPAGFQVHVDLSACGTQGLRAGAGSLCRGSPGYGMSLLVSGAGRGFTLHSL